MKRDNLPWSQAASPSLYWNDNGVPASQRFNDVYFSQEDGLAESRHVFIEGNGLPERWHLHPDRTFCIFETGFGTGLNFLATWAQWLEMPDARPPLYYIAVDKYPLRPDDLRRALAQWPQLHSLGSSLLAHYPSAVQGQHRIVLCDGNIVLDLWWLDVQDTLEDLASLHRPLIDAWYLDGFAPARNSAMWTDEILALLGPLSRKGATFSTFTAVGQVRRDLIDAGFEATKREGFGRKRECLHGRLANAPTVPNHHAVTPWDLTRSAPDRPSKVLVIGAGLAGCFTAAALARRGLRVTVVDAGEIGDAGSGNLQGVLYTRLSRRHSALSDFALISFLHAAARYRDMFALQQLTEGIDGALCGTFAQMSDADEMAYLADALAQMPEVAEVLDADAASERLGIDQPSPGYWFAQSGWLNPRAVCHALLANSGISVVTGCGAVSLRREQRQWQIVSGQKQRLAEAPCAVIAAGIGSSAFDVCSWLPTRAIRGQTTQLYPAQGIADLRAVLCHKGYIAPATTQGHCIGATFHPDDHETGLRESDTRANIEHLEQAIPAWAPHRAALEVPELDGRVGWRCASPDYLPLVGPAPDLEGFRRRYAKLRHNAQRPIAQTGEFLPGLYINTGHGSRGLSSTPLAAEVLASQICNEAPPLERSLSRALAPARFIIRDLARNKI